MKITRKLFAWSRYSRKVYKFTFMEKISHYKNALFRQNLSLRKIAIIFKKKHETLIISSELKRSEFILANIPTRAPSRILSTRSTEIRVAPSRKAYSCEKSNVDVKISLRLEMSGELLKISRSILKLQLFIWRVTGDTKWRLFGENATKLLRLFYNINTTEVTRNQSS